MTAGISPRGNTPSIYNATAWSALTDVASDGQPIEALLLEYEPDGQEEKLAWGFLINPQSLDFENSAQYGEVAPHATTVTSSQYSHTAGQTFTTPNMQFALWCCNKSAKTLLDGLKKLLEADTGSDRFSPPLLRFSWGAFNLGPLSLLRYSYKIVALSNGEPTDVKDLTLTFKEQPRPLTQAEQEERAQERLRQAISDRAAQGGPDLPLTERQQEDAKTRAQEFLQKNSERFSADVQAAIRGAEYTLEVDPETGLVSMKDSEGEELGFVSQYDAEHHKVGRNVTTLPLSEGSEAIADGWILTGGTVVPPQTETPPTAATVESGTEVVEEM